MLRGQPTADLPSDRLVPVPRCFGAWANWGGVVPHLDVDRRQSFRTGLQEVVAVGEELLHGKVRVRSACRSASFAQHSFDDLAVVDVRQMSTRQERKPKRVGSRQKG